MILMKVIIRIRSGRYPKIHFASSAPCYNRHLALQEIAVMKPLNLLEAVHLEHLLRRVARAYHLTIPDSDDFVADMRVMWLTEEPQIVRSCKHPEHFDGYLFRLFSARCSKWCRSHTWRQQRRELPLDDGVLGDCVRRHDSPEVMLLDQESEAALARRIGYLARAVDSLRPLDQLIVRARYWDRKSVLTIADELHLTRTAVDNRLYRARLTLRAAVLATEAEAAGHKEQRKKGRK